MRGALMVSGWLSNRIEDAHNSPLSSMVADGEDECPWVVRWLHAELPRRLNHPRDSLEAMYELFALAEQQLQRSQTAGEGLRVCINMPAVHSKLMDGSAHVTAALCALLCALVGSNLCAMQACCMLSTKYLLTQVDALDGLPEHLSSRTMCLTLLCAGSQASIDIWDRRLTQAAGSLMTQHLR